MKAVNFNPFCLFNSSPLSSSEILQESRIQNPGENAFLFSADTALDKRVLLFDLRSSPELQEPFIFTIDVRKLKLQVAKFPQAAQIPSGSYFNSGLFGSKESMKNLFRNLPRFRAFSAKLSRLCADPAHLHLPGSRWLAYPGHLCLLSSH